MTAYIATSKQIINLAQRVNLVSFNVQVPCLIIAFKATFYTSSNVGL